MDKNTIIGIDFGTTNSVVSVLDDKEPRTVKIDNNKLLPSAVSLTENGFIVGQVAKNMSILEPENTSLSIKREMGKDEVINLGDKALRPEEIASLILKKIGDQVKKELNLEVDKLRSVVTVPAYFTEEQRLAVKQAAELANLKVERIINEPTAAALAFGLDKIDNAAFAIYDLGGGTFDVSIVENADGIVEVLATTGDNYLGGDDFDNMLAEHIWVKFIGKNQLKVEKTIKISARLKKIAEETKIKLSTEEKVNVKENFFYKQGDDVYHIDMIVYREDFERLIKPLINKTVLLIQNAIDDAEITPNDLEGIILVGGSSRIPLVSRIIEKKFDIIPSLIDLPDEAVSHGATIQGAIINKIDIDTILVDITPHSLGIKVRDQSPIEELLLKALQEGKDPKDIQMPEEIYSTGVLIPRNTPIPAKKTEEFGAVVPFQKGYNIEVFQGEHKDPTDNKLIGDTHLEVEKPDERGGVEITFELDINGILNVRAVQRGADNEVKATFKSSKGRKIRKSNIVEEIATIDDASLTIINRAESLIKDKELSKDDKNELETLISKFKDAKVKDDDKAEIEGELLDLLYYLEEDK